jgi:hypothetical protein
MKENSDSKKANLMFFGNMANISMQIEELESFLNEMNLHISRMNEDLSLINSSDDNSDELENLKYHYKYTHGDITHKTIIISLIILLESEIEIYCEEFKIHKNLSINFSDFRGSFLEKFKLYAQKLINLAFDFNSSQWQDIIGIYEIRNSIIHNRSSLEDFGKRKAVENFVKRHATFSIENDWIKLTHQSCYDSIQIIKLFFEALTSYALEIFPGDYGPKKN